MKSFIEELYYGNIDPQNSGFEDDEGVQRTMQTIRENEDFLADTLTGEEKKRFLDFADAWSQQDQQDRRNQQRRPQRLFPRHFSASANRISKLCSQGSVVNSASPSTCQPTGARRS